jgi:pimeloyl-ACP methyl ester carboxylesterase
MMAMVMRFAATNVREAMVPHAGHWPMEENQADIIKRLMDLLQ